VMLMLMVMLMVMLMMILVMITMKINGGLKATCYQGLPALLNIVGVDRKLIIMLIFSKSGTPYPLFYKAGMQSGYENYFIACFYSVEHTRFFSKRVNKAGMGTCFFSKRVSKAGMDTRFFSKQVCSTLQKHAFKKNKLFSFYQTPKKY
jgi:hypothetical protein